MARDGREALAEIVHGISVETTATLRNWSADPRAPIRFYIRRDATKLAIGSAEPQAETAIPPYGLDFTAEALPSTRTSRA